MEDKLVNEIGKILRDCNRVNTRFIADIMQTNQHALKSVMGHIAKVANASTLGIETIAKIQATHLLTTQAVSEIIGPMLNASTLGINTIAKIQAVELHAAQAALEQIYAMCGSFSINWEDVRFENDSIFIDGEEVTQADIIDGATKLSDLDANLWKNWDQLPRTVRVSIETILKFVCVPILWSMIVGEPPRQLNEQEVRAIIREEVVQQVPQKLDVQEFSAIILQCLQSHDALKQSALYAEPCEAAMQDEACVPVEPPLPESD